MNLNFELRYCWLALNNLITLFSLAEVIDNSKVKIEILVLFYIVTFEDFRTSEYLNRFEQNEYPVLE